MLLNLISTVQAAQTLPAGRPITLGLLDSLIRLVAHFLIAISLVVAVISFIISAFMIMSGNEKWYKQGKTMFSQVVWGSAVILGTGLILGTIWNLVSLNFFCELKVPFVNICLWP